MSSSHCLSSTVSVITGKGSTINSKDLKVLLGELSETVKQVGSLLFSILTYTV